MKKIITLLLAIPMLVGCIEPPLHLPDDINYRLDVSISTDTVPASPYVTYTMPTYYELRRYYGSGNEESLTMTESTSLFNASFSRGISLGVHDALVWSNIDSPDGTQVVTVDESTDSIVASTTVSGSGGLSLVTDNDTFGIASVRNQPEMFYRGRMGAVTLTDTAQFDSYDDETITYIKNARVVLRPVVYGYRVEVIIYNNDGHINGTTGSALLTSMADGVCLSSGYTLSTPCGVFFNMSMQRNVEEEKGKADALCGALTTFGLCGMSPYQTGQTDNFNGGRTDLRNYVFFTLTFTNKTSRTYYADVTQQVRSQCHGGKLRIEIDATTIHIPDNPNPDHNEGTGFGPTVDDFAEDVSWEGTI